MTESNPHEKPEVTLNTDNYSHNIEQVASGQRMIIYAILINIGTIALIFAIEPTAIAGLLMLVGTILAIIGVVRLATGLGHSIVMIVLYVIFMFIPLIGLITLLVLNSKATNKLREASYRVGLLGASKTHVPPGQIKKQKAPGQIMTWFFILIPPLLMLILFVMPPDTIFWQMGALAVFISILSVIVKLGKKIRGEENYALVKKIIRPGLVMVIFLATMVSYFNTIVSADNYTKEIGRGIQAECRRKGTCPEMIDGWKSTDKANVSKSQYTSEFGVSFPMYYTLSENKKEFSIVLWHRLGEASLLVEGGVDRELSHE